MRFRTLAALLAAIAIMAIAGCGWLQKMFGAPDPNESVLCTIAGIVKDSDYKPVEGALVRLGSSGPTDLTGLAGQFSINIPTGTWYLEVMKDGYIQHYSASVYVHENNRFGRLDCYMYKQAETGIGGIAGKVSLPGRTSNEGALVKVLGTELTDTSDSEGNYHILKIPGGIYSLSCSCPGFLQSTTTNIDVSSALVQTINFALNDSTAPSASYLKALSKYVPDINVSLEFGVFDQGSGVVDMILSEDQNFFGAQWQPYTEQLNFMVSAGQGMKTVYGKCRDHGGLESNLVSVTVTLDETAPNAISDFQVTDSGYPVGLQWTDAGDPYGEIGQYDVRFSTSAINAGNWDQASPATLEPLPGPEPKSMDLYDIEENDSYYFAIKAMDKAGNASTLASVGPYAITRPVLAYASIGGSGVEIVNVDNPASTSTEGFLGVVGYALDIDFRGRHAFLADYDVGFLIWDVHDPSSPVQGTYYFGSDVPQAIDVVGNLAYIAGDDSGLEIVDITDISTSEYITNVRTVTTTSEDGPFLDVQVVGNYAYVAAFDDGLHIVDISNPALARIEKTVDTPGRARAVCVEGNYVYVADDVSGLQIIDISDIDNAQIVATVDTPGDAMDVCISGGYAYVADYSGHVRVIDIDPLSSASVVKSLTMDGAALGIDVRDGYVYVAEGNLKIIDISDPPNANVAGTHVTSGSCNGIKVR